MDLSLAKCKQCNLQGLSEKGTEIQPVPGDGPVPAEAMLVGRNPGWDENRLLRPFVGSAGRVLNSLLTASGWNREDMYISNVVKCFTEGNKPPTAKEIQSCLPVLLSEIDEVNPKILILVGNEAMEAIVGKTGILSWRGSSWWDEELKLIVLVTLHPSYLMQGQWHMFGYVLADLKKAKRLLNEGWTEPNFTYITDPTEAKLWFQEFLSEQT